MASGQPLQTNFTSGEISPYMYSRTELQQYANSARQITNFIVRPQGGLLKRSGTICVTPIKNSANDAVLIPFKYSNTDAYIIEVGAGYFRFCRDGGQILSSTGFTNGTMTSNITSWTTNSTGTGSAAWDAANSGSGKLAGGAAGVGSLYQGLGYLGTSQYTVTVSVYTNTVTYKVGTTVGASDIATGTLSAGAGQTFSFTPSTEGTVYVQFSNAANNSAYVNTISISTPIYQVANPFSQDEIADVRWAQSYDTIYFFHNNHPPFYMQRVGHADWFRTTISFLDGPYYNVADSQYGGIGTGITIASSGTTGSVTLTASSSLFVSTDVGRLIRYRSVNTAAWGWATITAYTSGTSVTATITKAFDAATASLQWRLGYFSATTGYPSVGTIIQQRLVLGATTTKKQTLFFGVTADLYNMQPDDTAYKDNQIDSSAMVYTLADNEGNVINGFSTLNWFFVYTSGGIFLIDSSSSPGGPLTPETIYAKKVISEAAAATPPAVCRTSVVYPHSYGRKLLEIGYNYVNNSYEPKDLAVLAEQRTIEQIQSTVVQTSPNYIVWNRMQDGTLSAVTYFKEQQITGWHGHILAGTGPDGEGTAVVKSIAVIPGDIEDQVWMIVERQINGANAQYIEYFAPTFLLNSDVTDAMFLDCGFHYSGGSTLTLSGLTLLEGEEVTVFGNGGVVPTNGPVTAGSISLQTAVTDAWVGLSYTSTLVTNVPHMSDQAAGSSTGRLGRIDRADIQLYNSYGGRIGSDADNCEIIAQYGSTTIMGGPITLTSGLIPFKGLLTDYSKEPTIYIDHDLPVPMFIGGIIYRTSFANKP